MHAVDAAAHRSRWRARHPAEKLAVSAALLSAVPVAGWAGPALVAAAGLALLLGPAGTAPSVLLRAARGPAAFVLLGAVSTALVLAPPGGGAIGVTGDSLVSAGTLVARGAAGFVAVLVLAATTPLADALSRLSTLRVGRRRVPPAVVELVALTYRLLFVVLGTARAVREAQAGRLGYAGLRTSYRSAGLLGAALLTRSLDRARRLGDGLAGRGYDGRLRVLVAQRRVSRPVVAAALAGAVALHVAAPALQAAL